ncbi:hypothetical protein CAEBREN_17868 [Caenorhabditis brenneri]|uniref:Elongator complex protein 6 n=1 Tax=Caenorhabditis brenneri TaxID=135651 RepID=G0MXG9_CAEBE|nr:hypothetical protein CAEBREN_17868 [Caenorhabditis brenneri]
MLKILKGQEDSIKGLIVCEETGNASSLPLALHFLSIASTSNQKVAIVSSKFTETNYKLICSKAGIRWNPSQIKFHEFLNAGKFDISGNQLMENVYQNVADFNPSVVIFDDISILELFDATAVEVTVFVHTLYSVLAKNSPENAILLAPFSITSTAKDLLRTRCHIYAQLTPVGHGFGKDASAKMVLSTKSKSSPITKKGILISGERTINGSWVSVN